MIRIAVAEAQTITRWALRAALTNTPGMQVVADAGTVADALAMLQTHKPDVLLLDMTLAGHDALTEIRELEACPPIVMFAPWIEPTCTARAIAAGAHGCVAKTADPEQLLDAIRAVSRGEQVLPPGVEALLAAGTEHPASALTKRELQVMEMIARGMTNREIAHDLDISVKTIDTHRGHILKKLGLRNNSELTRFAVKHGYVGL